MLLLDLYICCTNIKVGIGVINMKFRIVVTIDEGGLGLGVGRDYQGPNGRRWGPWSMDYESPSSRPLSCLRWREGRQPTAVPPSISGKAEQSG